MSLPQTLMAPLSGRVSVLGLGRTGLAVAVYLARRGCDVLASDARDALDAELRDPLDDAGVRVVLGTNEVRERDLVVISPGIKPSSELYRRAAATGREVISEPELFARVCDRPIVAVTGTDGKSTVTTWTAHLLESGGVRARAGGNLGNPLVAELDEPFDVAVLEISAFQLVSTPTLVPAVAAVTNVADDHLDYFDGDRAAYEAAKRRLVELCRPGSAVVRPADHPIVSRWPLPEGVRDVRVDDGGPWDEAVAGASLPLAGRHNRVNAAMSLALAELAGADPEGARAGLTTYEPLPHRCELVRLLDDVRWVDDSKATNPHAAAAALHGLDSKLVLIAGGSDKATDFSSFGRLASEKARAVVLIGETADAIAAALAPGLPVERAESMEDAVARARGLAEAGDTVLLSPACASFDMFRSYAHRGEVFAACVGALESSPS